MTRTNALTAAPPVLVESAIRELGGRLRAARLARNLTVATVAERIGTGPRAVMDAERGKPTASIAVFVALLWAYDLLSDFKLLADPARDAEAQARLRSRTRARSGKVGSLDNDF